MGITVDELTRFEPLRAEWDEVLRGSSGGLNIFSTWPWQQLWWRIFGGDSALRLLAIRDEGALIGIWPLMQEGQILTLVGGVEVCDYLDVIALAGREPAVLQAGLEHLPRDATRLDLRFVPPDSPTLKILPSLAESKGWVAERSEDEVCPTVALPSDWEQYLGSLRKKDRHELRRKLRRLEAVGEVRWEVRAGPEGLAEDTADFVRLHRMSRPDKAAFMDRQMEEFFAAVIRAFRPDGLMKMYFLSLGGTRVAATLCIEHRDELWLYNSGFDRDYAHYSVGLLLKAFCVQDAIAEHKRAVNFLRGREPYKYDLGAHDEPVYRLQLTRG